ncbi:hypothetical protein CTAYLR_006312 [Chrysophaeum taylorii]|uniref:Thioesterase domain-containing protein n=1 Tax=Chrysophaeum taylorii TaxID=2483200 RepID=A0AAD7XIT4_9STRA|nr:hypothetical protein CTAYLR_006312 [Chrysophaeum taylorii]
MAGLKKYGAWVDLGPKVEVEETMVGIRVICIPQAGMGAWAFHGWQAKVGPRIEIIPVELPGRNTRMMEAKPEDMHATVGELVANLPLDKPYVIMGHSLGAWMAYESARLVLEKKLRAPLALVVSGARAAHLASLSRDTDTRAPALGGLPSAAFWENFERRYGKNPDLQLDTVRRYVEPLLRADFRLLETYEPKVERLPIPIVACGARGDDRFTSDQLEAWREHTSSDAFDVQWFDVTPLPWSTPHRYLVEDPADFIAFLAAYCDELLPPILPGPYVVVSKKGALVREGIDLDSPQVAVLESGKPCRVAEVRYPTGGSKPRARVDHPVAGWLSPHLLAAAANNNNNNNN